MERQRQSVYKNWTRRNNYCGRWWSTMKRTKKRRPRRLTSSNKKPNDGRKRHNFKSNWIMSIRGKFFPRPIRPWPNPWPGRLINGPLPILHLLDDPFGGPWTRTQRMPYNNTNNTHHPHRISPYPRLPRGKRLHGHESFKLPMPNTRCNPNHDCRRSQPTTTVTPPPPLPPTTTVWTILIGLLQLLWWKRRMAMTFKTRSNPCFAPSRPAERWGHCTSVPRRPHRRRRRHAGSHPFWPNNWIAIG